MAALVMTCGRRLALRTLALTRRGAILGMALFMETSVLIQQTRVLQRGLFFSENDAV